ncbi:VOC family protein [Nocardioides houyundeii]|uniref:VOC family protein n=1 Tax=Nocardioides houyundeii TaxID=2045452 RepID=UPI000C790263|nr:VOC family protein [Nocardioides houyundeii]
MTSRLNPYLNFDGRAREALDFYRGVLGGELHLSTFGEYGDPAAPGADLVMHGQLETPDGFTLMVADLPPGETHSVGTNIQISLSGDDAEALRGYFAALGDGGTVTVPLEKQMWGDEFGMLTDRFGIGWMVNVAGDAA